MNLPAHLHKHPDHKLLAEFQRLYRAVNDYQGSKPDEFKKLLGQLLHTTKHCMIKFAATEEVEFQNQMEASFKFLDAVFKALLELGPRELSQERIISIKNLLHDYYEGIFAEPVWQEMRVESQPPRFKSV